jgi:hypothetical protein
MGHQTYHHISLLLPTHLSLSVLIPDASIHCLREAPNIRRAIPLARRQMYATYRANNSACLAPDLKSSGTVTSVSRYWRNFSAVRCPMGSTP